MLKRRIWPTGSSDTRFVLVTGEKMRHRAGCSREQTCLGVLVEIFFNCLHFLSEVGIKIIT